MAEIDDEKKAEVELTIHTDGVKTKYKVASDIVNEVLRLLCSEAKVGKTPVELAELGDKEIEERTLKVYNKFDKGPKKISRGIAFPTCISVNNIVCHYSPLPDGQVALKAGDVVKIDLGVQIDGYPAVAAHTVVVQEEAAPISGRVADLVQAAQMMIDVAARCLTPGKKNNDIPPLWEKIAAAFGVNVCEGILSHELKRYVLDGNQCIISKASVERRVEDVEFASAQVWTLDVVVSTGKGKLQEGDARCCVFKRNPEQQYMLKLKASKDALKEINTRFEVFPFSIRALDAKSGRLGVNECVKHDLLIPYPVLYEKQGETVVHFKRTVFVFNSKTELVAGLEPIQEFVSEKKCDDAEIQEILKTSLTKQKARKAKDSKAKEGTPTEGEAVKEDTPK